MVRELGQRRKKYQQRMDPNRAVGENLLHYIMRYPQAAKLHVSITLQIDDSHEEKAFMLI